ncbi:30S ribosomal protein S9 [Candidatus Marinamargulisbacteria bacterium SCGC AG-439-L15]|nr:30S ribosomal protein S9 [Candidatus Marinamargulisbacteria bacterium SCGC AG-439-L15]
MAKKTEKETTSKKTTAAKKSASTKSADSKKAVSTEKASKSASTKVAVKTKSAKQSVELKVPTGAFYGTGRRKESIAKVWVFPGSGQVVINDKTALEAVKRDVLVEELMKPLLSLQLDKKLDVKISTVGGGLSGQAGACQLGIARAILSMDENFRAPLREGGYLTRDTRVKERKKYGRRGARKGAQFRKR